MVFNRREPVFMESRRDSLARRLQAVAEIRRREALRLPRLPAQVEHDRAAALLRSTENHPGAA
jgi:hypothetical protein